MSEEVFRELCEPEWLDWYALSPVERWNRSQELWNHYLQIGGSLEPEPDTQSPFFDEQAWSQSSPHGGTGLRLIRRGGI